MQLTEEASYSQFDLLFQIPGAIKNVKISFPSNFGLLIND
jgi:hypothetical protein